MILSSKIFILFALYLYAMKQINIFKKLILASMLVLSAGVHAQIHPLAFGVTAFPNPNWYQNYVGIRFTVTAPSVIAGDKIFTAAAPGWGGPLLLHWLMFLLLWAHRIHLDVLRFLGGL